MEESSLIKNRYQLLMIGGSAGSLEVILKLLPELELSVTLAIIIIIHRKTEFESKLADLLAGKTKWRVKEAEEKEFILPGTIYLAPPDYHLLIEKDFSLSLDYSEKVHYSRPAIDPSFETAAEAYGKSMVSILLSGANADGTAGLIKVKSLGGLTVVQDPATADVAYMPKQAVLYAAPDRILDAKNMSSFINSLK